MDFGYHKQPSKLMYMSPKLPSKWVGPFGSLILLM